MHTWVSYKVSRNVSISESTMQPMNDWYKSNKLPIYVIFLIYIADLKGNVTVCYRWSSKLHVHNT